MKDQSEGTFSSVIPANQYGILHAEFRTGIVTDRYGHRELMGNIQDYIQYLIFTSLDDARAYAKQKIMESPEIECVIFNDKREAVDVLRNTEYITCVMREERERNEARRSRKPWWKLW
jgi:hypothetical protein